MCALLLIQLPAVSMMLPVFAQPANPLVDTTETSVPLHIHLEPHGSALAYLVVDVAVDEEFVAIVGAGWEHEVREMIDGANKLMGQLGIELEVGSLQRWLSDDAVGDAPELLTEASSQTLRRYDHALLAVTGQAAKPLDG